MRLYPEKLAAQLQQSLLPVYLVSGDEPLLVQECCDLIRQQARAQGCSDRELIDAGSSGFNWHDLLHSATSMSLFAERKLVELRLPSGKPGADGSKALCEYLDISSGEDVLLIISGKIDKQSTNSKWYKALDKAGATIQVWPVDAQNLPRWLQQRVRNAGMSIDPDAPAVTVRAGGRQSAGSRAGGGKAETAGPEFADHGTNRDGRGLGQCPLQPVRHG